MSRDFASVCPYCDQHHEVATQIGGDAMPSEGDLTMCFKCGEFSIFDHDAPGGLRKPTAAEMREMTRRLPLQRMKTEWRKIRQ